VKSDWLYCLSRGEVKSFFYSPILRFAQCRGRREGFLEGLRERET